VRNFSKIFHKFPVLIIIDTICIRFSRSWSFLLQNWLYMQAILIKHNVVGEITVCEMICRCNDPVDEMTMSAKWSLVKHLSVKQLSVKRISVKWMRPSIPELSLFIILHITTHVSQVMTKHLYVILAIN